jgi:type VI secretion system protein ImpM
VSGEASAAVPGWYGKLPALGDFVGRRLPPEFVRPWDTWLQERMGTTRATLGDAWLDCYLTAPIWRFVLLPGLVGESGWAGVLMPSVDRVGRHFPLTVAVALPSVGAAARIVFDGEPWLAGLEEAALAALEVTRGPDDLDAALAEHSLPLEESKFTGTAGSRWALPSPEAFGPLARTEALRAWSGRAGWRGLWWTRGRMDGEPLALASGGLPRADEFGWLIQARWTAAPASGAAELRG